MRLIFVALSIRRRFSISLSTEIRAPPFAPDMRLIDARDHKFSNRDEVEHCASSPIKRPLPDLPCIVQRKSVLIDSKRSKCLSAKMVTVFVSISM